MGMYTEIYARGTLRKSTPPEVIGLLERMAGDRYDTDQTLPDHDLFKTERWDILGCGASAYFPATVSKVELDHFSKNWSFLFHSNLKNYGGEIGKFFDWVDQYVEGGEGEYLGYSMYEETEPGEAPRSYFKQVSSWQ